MKTLNQSSVPTFSLEVIFWLYRKKIKNDVRVLIQLCELLSIFCKIILYDKPETLKSLSKSFQCY